MTESLERYLDEQLDSLKQQSLLRSFRVLEGPQEARARIDGQEVINLSSNNYLGLANHPQLKQAAISAIEELGVGAGAARTIIGTMAIHERLERRLAEFKHTEAALVLQGGYTANAAVLGTLLAEGDLVISDALNHASIIDGIRLTKATRRVYDHVDMDALEQVLKQTHGQYAKTVIVTDGVFSMDGNIAPLDRVADLAEHYGAITMVDDAHASGVLGQRGSGTVSHYSLNDRWDIQVGTLSKAIGAVGGYVACSHKLRQLMEHRARPLMFSTSHPPAIAASCIAALDLLAGDEGQVLLDRLWANTRLFKSGLEALGFNTGSSQTPITPVIVGESTRALQFSNQLFTAGVFAQGIAFPTVARDQGRVRTIVTAAHTRADLAAALDIFASVGRAMELI